MKVKGLEKFREKLPWYSGKRVFLLIIIPVFTACCSLIFQFTMDSSPRLFRDFHIFQFLALYTPIIGSGIILTLGFILVYTFWRRKENLIKKDKIKAYQKAFPIALTGIALVISFVIHSIFPHDLFIPDIDSSDLRWYFSIPLNEIFFNTHQLFFFTRMIVAFLIMIQGFWVIFKSLFVFGIDNMGLVYVYYPEESKIVDHEIYSVLRHPTYHGLILVLMGSFFLRFTLYSIIFFFIFFIGINFHLKFVEEKELIKRFGRDYREYKNNVPALFFKLKDIKKYYSFLF
jgi:protein-S-isoprenylcysteine O-methyltransferase Ste14